MTKALKDITEEHKAMQRRIAQLETFARMVAYGPPKKGEPIKLLNKFVDVAQKLVPKGK
jgi:hypothetical protein